MNTIWKYEIQADDETTLHLPKGAKPLSVQVQNGQPCLWCLVDDQESIYETRRFRLIGTGQPITDSGLVFLGTFQLYGGSFVGHLFELK